MDVLMLSRLQFAATTYFHFLFVPFTLGMSIAIAVMQTMWLRRGDEDYKRMAKFFGKLFLINFAVGVVTGITLEFQFGTNWSGYSAYVGDIFGSLLAIEATVAFFLESVFIGLWIFGWDKLSPKLHTATIWLVAIGSNFSAFWILTANTWMQRPTGYLINEATGRAELTSFFEVVVNQSVAVSITHTVFAAWALAGFVILAVSSWHMLKGSKDVLHAKAFRFGGTMALVFSLLVAFAGHFSAEDVATHQPAKLAAMESHWETTDYAPMPVIVIPDVANERNSVEAIKIPYLLSVLAGYTPDTVVKGLKEFPVNERPPVVPVFTAFRLMVLLGTLMIGVAGLAFLVGRKDPMRWPWLNKLLIWFMPVPWVAILAGWTVAELGRQPWIVQGLLKTEDAVSGLLVSQVAISLLFFFLVYSLLGAVDYFLLFKFARKGPEAPAGDDAVSAAAK